MFETWWPYIVPVIAVVATYLIKNYVDGKTLDGVFGTMGAVGKESLDVITAIRDGLKPEEDGSVVWTPEEVQRVKDEINDLIELITNIVPDLLEGD